MPNVIAAIAPRRSRKPNDSERDCLVQVRAEVISLGGAILVGVCALITALFFMVMAAPNGTGAQRFIAVVLLIGCWAYALNSLTERLSLVDHTLVFSAVLNKTRRIPLDELEAMILTHEGLNLERGIETLELRCTGRKPDRIALGPCWQHRKLERFVQSVEEAMHQT